MSEVPDDLMKVAREVADDHDAKMKALYGPTASTRRAYMIELVAVALAAERERATLAERERGAALAKSAWLTIAGRPDDHDTRLQHGDRIASAILARP